MPEGNRAGRAGDSALLADSRAPTKRPFGRSIDDFRTEETDSGLWPAEDKLLANAVRGETTKLITDEANAGIRQDLQKAFSDAEALKLAAEVVVQASKAKDTGLYTVPDPLKTRVEAQPRILQGYFAELPRYIEENAKDVKPRLPGEPDLLLPHFQELLQIYARQVAHWRRVDPADRALRVRADFLRFLALGGDETAPVHEKGVQIEGAYIKEVLNLGGCSDVRPLFLRGCRFDGQIYARDARLHTVSLAGSRTASIDAVGARIEGGLYLDDLFAESGVWLVNADISGNLECFGSRFRAGPDNAFGAFACGQTNIGGEVFLGQNFTAEGQVSFWGAKLRGSLNCTGQFRNRTEDGRGVALLCERADIVGHVVMQPGFNAEGHVTFWGARIGGSLECKGKLNNQTKDGQGSALGCTGARIKGQVVLRDGFSAVGEVSFFGAEIGGTLDCTKGIFDNKSEDGRAMALRCGGAKVAGDVVLADGFDAKGLVSLWGAEIGGSLDCPRGSFHNRTADGEGVALDCSSIKVAKHVGLGPGFIAEGQVAFWGANIVGSLTCTGMSIDNLVPTKEQWTNTRVTGRIAALALNMSVAEISGQFLLRHHVGSGDSSDPSIPTTIRGSADVQGTHVRLLCDEPAGWPEPWLRPASGGKPLRCALFLDNFTYDRLAEGAPTHARNRHGRKGRLAWLDRQHPEHLRGDFRPQPFEHLIKVLREMGHDDDARQITIEKQRRKRRGKWATIWRDLISRPTHWWRWVLKPFELVATAIAAVGLIVQWLVLDVFLGAGYAKVKPILLFVVILLGCGLFYHQAAEQMVFVPSNPVLFKDLEVRRACAGNDTLQDIDTPIDWFRCKRAPPELNVFRPLVYSLDQMIPFVQLGQKRDWQPTAKAIELRVGQLDPIELPTWTTQVVTWSQNIGSMVLYLLLVAIFGGLIKRD